MLHVLLLVAMVAAEEAPPDDDHIVVLTLDDLLAYDLEVASKVGRNLRDTPGVVTLVTREQIRTSGARDLLDVLRLVPGFEPGLDVVGVVGLGFRGTWGHEGKILLLIDGIQMNERAYSSLQLGGHYDVASIERVEIIRGPGSVIYGGYAELAVINVVTRSGAAVNGLSFSGQMGQMGDAMARRNVSVSLGGAAPDGGPEAVLHVFGGAGRRSDGIYNDFYGGSAAMAESSRLDPMSVNAGFRYGGLELRAIYDDYQVVSPDGYDVIVDDPRGYTSRFTATELDARGTITLGDELRLLPRVSYSHQAPWENVDRRVLGTVFHYATQVERLTGSISAVAAPMENVDLTAGLEVYRDRAIIDETEKANYVGVPRTSDNAALFAEALWQSPWVDIAAGGRFERHSVYGNSFVPRLALTRTFDDVHLKALASQAFRAPSFENVALAADIVPERTTVFEVEAGYKAAGWLFVTVNAFDVTIKRPIIYFYDEVNDADLYANEPKTGSSGAELELRMQGDHSGLTLGYSYYIARNFFFGEQKNRVETYRVQEDGDVLMGMSPHKLAGQGHVAFGPLSLSLTGTVWAGRHAFVGVDADEEPFSKQLAPTVLLDTFVSYDDFLTSGLSLGAGVYDIFHRKNHVYVQPYNGYHAPLPMGSREYVVRLNYEAAL